MAHGCTPPLTYFRYSWSSCSAPASGFRVAEEQLQRELTARSECESNVLRLFFSTLLSEELFQIRDEIRSERELIAQAKPLPAKKRSNRSKIRAR